MIRANLIYRNLNCGLVKFVAFCWSWFLLVLLWKPSEYFDFTWSGYFRIVKDLILRVTKNAPSAWKYLGCFKINPTNASCCSLGFPQWNRILKAASRFDVEVYHTGRNHHYFDQILAFYDISAIQKPSNWLWKMINCHS